MTEQLLIVARTYCALTGRSLSRLSTLIWGDGGRLDGIERGRDLGTRNYERALGWLSDHWPAEGDWPAAVARPAPKPRAAADSEQAREALQ